MKFDVVYRHIGTNSEYNGYLLGEGFAEYMQRRVFPWHRDEDGTGILQNVLNAKKTGFASDILESHVSAVSWRIGESLAECFLMDYHNLSIPYNKMRDMPNPNASRSGVEYMQRGGGMHRTYWSHM